MVDGDKYRVVRVEGKERIGGGRPGVHVLEVVGDEIQVRFVLITELLIMIASSI